MNDVFLILLNVKMLFGSNNYLMVDPIVVNDISPFHRYHTTYNSNSSQMLINDNPTKLLQDIVCNENITVFFILTF